MKISDAGLSLIHRFETCQLVAYKPTPDDVWTLGWGHTKDVSEGDSCTQGAADAMLVEDLKWVEDCIADHVSVMLLQGQYDALCSFIYNLGCPAFAGSTLLKLLNAGEYEAVPAQFLRWNKQAGQVLAGLTVRRTAESELFAYG